MPLYINSTQPIYKVAFNKEAKQSNANTYEQCDNFARGRAKQSLSPTLPLFQLNILSRCNSVWLECLLWVTKPTAAGGRLREAEEAQQNRAMRMLMSSATILQEGEQSSLYPQLHLYFNLIFYRGVTQFG